MSIEPLQGAMAPASASGIFGSKQRGNDRSSFNALLDAIDAPLEGKAVAASRAAAELLRMEMMQSSLSISGDTAEPAGAGTLAVRNFLAHLGAANDLSLNQACPVPAPFTAPVEPPQASMSVDATDLDSIGATAAQYLGTPYRFGGEGVAGIDCSSFVQHVYREHQVELPRTAREQIEMGTDVAEGDLRKGDLVFFQTYASYPSHVGIYLGDGKMIHASSGKGEVTISDLKSDYYRHRYLGARRVV